MSTRYSAVAISLHWLIAAAILANLGLGWWMTRALDDGDTAAAAITGFQVHKSLGLTILLLSLARLAWRLTHRPPPAPPMPRWQHWAASATHALFYLLMLALPLSGWLLVSTQWREGAPLTLPTLWFGLFEVPHLFGLAQADADTRAAVATLALDSHLYLGWLMGTLLLLHVGAALKHQYVDHDGLLNRMQPRAPQALALLLLGLAAGGGIAWQWWAGPVATPAAPGGIQAAPGSWPIDAEQSYIRFAGTHAKRDFAGHFERWQSDIVIVPEALQESRIRVTVQTGSALTGVRLQEDTLPEREWFDTAQYPSAQFTATGITPQGDGQARIDGTLQIKDSALEIRGLTLRWDGTQAVITGTQTLDRADANLGMESDPQGKWVSREIAVEVRARLTPPKN